MSSGISSSFQVDVFVFYGYAPLLHPEIFVFFQFHVRHVLETSSTLTSTRSLCILRTSTCSILTWTHSGKVPENVQNNLTQTSGQNSVYIYSYVLFFIQVVELQSVRDQLVFSGFSSEVKTLSSEKTGSEWQQAAGLRSEGAVWFSTESNLSTGDSVVSSLSDFCRSHIYNTAFIHNLSFNPNLT